MKSRNYIISFSLSNFFMLFISLILAYKTTCQVAKTNLQIKIIIIILLVFFYSKNSYSQAYCTFNAVWNSSYPSISNVNFAGIDNSSSGGGYNNFLSSVGTVAINTPSKLTITSSGSNGTPGYYNIWIDWDHNGTFGNNANELILNATTPLCGSGTQTLMVTPPVGSNVGTTRMRIVCSSSSANPPACSAAAYWADVEDYTINVIGTAPCASASASQTAISNGDNTTLSVSGGSGYSWASNPGAWTSTSQSAIVSPTITTTYMVTVGGGSTCTSNVAVTVNVMPTITALSSGNWGTAGTWSTGAVPTLLSAVNIPAGITVTINSGANGQACGNLILNGILTTPAADWNNLTVYGNLSGSGQLQGYNASCTLLTLAGIDKTISGSVSTALTGSWTNTININGTYTINNGASFTLNNTSGSLNMNINGALTNYGTCTLGSNINTTKTVTISSGGQLINGVNSLLNIGAGTFTNSGTFSTTATGNTVDFNSTHFAQTIPGQTYYNLIVDKSTQTGTLGGATTVNGNLTINAGTMADGGNICIVKGNVVNNGTYTTTNSSGKLSMQGSISQNITGNGVYGQVEINNAAGVSLTVGADNTITCSGTNNYFNVLSGAVFTNGSLITIAKNFSNAGIFINQCSVTISGTFTNSGKILGGNPAYPDYGAFSVTGTNSNTGHFGCGIDDICGNSDDNYLIYSSGFALGGSIGMNVATSGSSTCLHPLPITLISFKVILNNSTVLLTWSTAAETNNNYFTIEKSTDGIHFIILQIVQGAGNSNVPLNYQIVDDNPSRGITYYRLSQTDFNGKEVTFPMVAINYQPTYNDQLIVFPNPASSIISLSVCCGIDDSKVVLTLRDVLGKICYHNIVTLGDSQVYSIDLKTNNIPGGLYFITAETNNLKLTKKIIVE